MSPWAEVTPCDLANTVHFKANSMRLRDSLVMLVQSVVAAVDRELHPGEAGGH